MKFDDDKQTQEMSRLFVVPFLLILIVLISFLFILFINDYVAFLFFLI